MTNRNYTPVFKEGNVDLSEFDYPRWGDPSEDEIKLNGALKQNPAYSSSNQFERND